MLTKLLFLENGVNYISIHSFSPIKGTRSKSLLKFHAARISDCDLHMLNLPHCVQNGVGIGGFEPLLDDVLSFSRWLCPIVLCHSVSAQPLVRRTHMEYTHLALGQVLL